MKLLQTTVLSLLLLAATCLGQTPSVLTNNNAPMASVNAVTQTGTLGSTVYYYWVVSIYAGGNSAPAGGIPTTVSNATLSSTNYNMVAFTAPASPLSAVTGYDILRTTTPTPPTGACACAVASNQAASPVNDQSNSLSAYTVTTLSPVVVAVVGDPVTATTPGANLKIGTVVIPLPQQAGGIPAAYFCGATTGTTTCANTSGGRTARVFGGIATLASNSAVISGISPAFTSTSTYTCVANDLTTRANVVQVANTSSSSITITNTTGASDVINYICMGY